MSKTSRASLDLEAGPAGPGPVGPAPSQPAPRASYVQTGMYMGLWILVSNGTILFNKWILDNAGFKYPIILTCWHLTFITILTQILARTTSLLDGRHAIPLDRKLFVKAILPIGVASSGSLILANAAYLHLSVSFIQILKALGPVIVLIVSVTMRMMRPTIGQIVNIAVIAVGVAIASAGEIAFNWTGLACQVGSLFLEATRVVLIQALLSSDGLDPLVGLFYFAPVGAVLNFLIALAAEVPVFDWDDLYNVGWLMLLLNGVMAFLLNVVSITLIGKTSALVSSLTGIAKNILLVACSVLIWATPVTGIQIFGYTLSLLAIIYYTFGAKQLLAAFHHIKARATGQYAVDADGEKFPRVDFELLLLCMAIFFFVCGCFIVGYQKGVMYLLLDL